MKTQSIKRLVTRILLPALAASTLSNCASFNHPLARHDMDGDGAISDSEYRQANIQYDLANHERADELSRTTLLTAQANNAGNFLAGANQAIYQLKNFGQ